MTIRAQLLKSGAVIHLLLDAPKANIIDSGMLTQIEEWLNALVKQDTKLIVFEGVGSHFSFGASVAEHTKKRARGMFDRFHGLFCQLADLAVPTLAVIRGQCLGGGLELASWCTWIVASPEARLGQPEIKLAVFPPMASLLLPWRVGGTAAMHLCVSGATIGAKEAHRIGLVSAVAEDPTAWWQTLYDEHLAPTSASSLRYAEQAVRAGLTPLLGDHLSRLERLYLDGLMTTHDANEGIAAFIARRPATFRNC